MQLIGILSKSDVEKIAFKVTQKAIHELLKSRLLNKKSKKLLEENAPVEMLKFSCRIGNSLNNANIYTIGQLISKTESDLIKMRNFGKLSLLEVKYKLLTIGYKLSEGSIIK